jgi:hypothetical protein
VRLVKFGMYEVAGDVVGEIILELPEISKRVDYSLK